MVHRPARTVPPLSAPERRSIEAPPNLPEGDTMSPLAAMMPMVGVMGSMVMMTVMRSSRFAVIGVFVLVAAVIGAAAMFFSQRGKARRRRRVQRERYLEYLEELREELAEEDRHRRATARAAHPPPAALVDILADQARLWERRRRDPDFLHLRLGAGPVPQRVLEIDRSQSTAITPVDPFMLNEAGELCERFGTTPDMPLTVPLDRVGNVSVVGSRKDTLRVLRVLLTQAAVSHAPDDLGMALCAPADGLGHYEWAKWLPHALDPDATDAAGAVRRIAADPAELSAVIAGELRTRAARVTEIRRGLGNKSALDNISRLLIVLDTPDGPATELARTDETVSLPELGVTVLHPVTRRVDEPGDVSVRIVVDGDRLTIEDLRHPTPRRLRGTLDDCPPQQSESLARLLAPLRLSPESDAGDSPLSAPVSFPELLGIDEPDDVDPARLWAPRGERDFLRVPIGVGDLHEPVMLDIKESAELGMGPHGLCVGATGSGKSELLRTLLLALVATHPPEDLAVVLVDYKGGATFAPFEPLPHVAGVITNLESVPGLVERVHASLAGEVKRRQQVLKDAGHFANVGDYNAARRRSRPDLDPLPHLFVVIDEFGELLTAKPDFIDLFLSIGRIGRSIGVHLLLSSQRIESGKLRGLETYLSYRLGLRTFSAEESRTVLDSKDAFELPPVPGFGYLKVDTSVYERFKAAYVSGAHQGPVRRAPAEAATPTVTVFPARNLPSAPVGEPAATRTAPPERDTKDTPTLLSTVVGALTTAADPVRQIWLPPLPAALTLDSAGGGITTTPDGLRLGGAPLGPLRVPVGLLDDPGEQWQGQWVIDLTVAGGHQAVIGGPQSGKTTLLRTLVLSLALTHTPRDVAVYGLDLVGGGLRPLEGLPHVGGIATRTDRERVTRTVDEIRSMLAEREMLFRDHGIDSVDSLRRARAAGRLPELGSTEIVLVIDGYGAIREEFDHLDPAIGDLLRRGGGYGIHVVAGMLRWNDVRINAQSSFGSRLELRLNDPHDSGIDRKLMEAVPTGTPGRALTDVQLFAHTALPRVDGAADEENAAGLEEAVRRVRESWTGEPVRAVRVLPPRLAASALPAFEGGSAVPFAVREDLTAVGLDLAGHDQHFIVLGDSECGKTNLLRLVADGLMERYSDDELVFAVIDPRRGLRTAVPERYRGGYAHNTELAGRLATGIAGKLKERMPEGDLGPEAMEPGGFSGPRIVVLIDDYDVLATANQRPLQPFLPFVPSAPDIGLHFVVARRMAGISRGFFEPFLQSLKENGGTTLLMTGDRQEGQIFPKLYPSAQPPGRGVLVRRGAPYQLVQTAML
ncbi:type VII secretion protein EccCa [Streptomyces spiramenti]|uniref:Type VII secretion protein EccCa n=1 Tax=Streptomyces spiramenti TaxID=2720606 RepID=A0ABX1AM12_9ACTN|nr:type VII secretion protein EccCa [Streptomyces spiramenti]NJP66696.1 type VII secretion protein EccCa [Streptomyces spiramenti]